MATQYCHFKDLKDGFNTCIIRARIVRTWNAIYLKNNTVLSKDMLLLDEEGICIHAQIPERINHKLEKSFVDGDIVKCQYFRLIPASASHRPVSYDKKIQFLKNTSVQSLSKDAHLPSIPALFFSFADLDIISSRQFNHYILTDVIGKVDHFGPARQVVANGVPTTVRDVRLKLLGDSVVNVSVWGECNGILKSMDLQALPQPLIIVVAAATVTTFQGKATLNTTSCSHVYINPDIPETVALKTRFATDCPIAINTTSSEEQADERSRAQRNRQTLSEIIAMEWSPDFKDETYTVSATIKSIDAKSGWCYNACNSCNTKVTYQGAFLFCQKCNQAISNASYRYKVLAHVFDETAKGEFTIFDRQIVRLIKVPAAQLINEQIGNLQDIPHQILNLTNQTLIFEVKVTDQCHARVEKLYYDTHI